MNFLMATKKFFGVLPAYKGGVGLKGFAEELKELSDKDREDLGTLLSEHFKETIEINKRD
ncbi:MAG: hypothetical protein V3V32_05395 [Dehalococcoidia bacterium]